MSTALPFIDADTKARLTALADAARDAYLAASERPDSEIDGDDERTEAHLQGIEDVLRYLTGASRPTLNALVDVVARVEAGA